MRKQIFLFVVLAFILRIIFIPGGAVSFHYDMSRDAFEALKIIKENDLKILGPPTSVPGLFHGPLYYYLIAPFYALGSGDPAVVTIFLSFLNSLTVIPIMLLAKDLFRKTIWALLSGLFFAVSFEAAQYGPWLSNPSPAMLTLGLYFLGLRFWQKGNTRGLYLATFSAALSTQFQFFLIYLFLLLPFFKYLFKIKTNAGGVGISLLITFLGLSSFLVGIIKFNSLGQILRGALNISVSTQVTFRTQFTDLILNYADKMSDLFINNFLPSNVFLGGILGIFVLYVLRKHPFILFCLLSNFPIFIFGGHTNTYANIGLVAPAILGVLVLLQNLWKINRSLPLTIILLILISNIYTILKISPKGQVMLVIPKDMILKNQLNLVDRTYKLAAGEPFSINTTTLPFWTNTTWAYLYSWYGKEKYGYVPQFYGRDQVGLLGAEVLPKIDAPLEKSFFIIEPHEGIPIHLFGGEQEVESGKTKLISEESFGALKLQIRQPLSKAHE